MTLSSYSVTLYIRNRSGHGLSEACIANDPLLCDTIYADMRDPYVRIAGHLLRRQSSATEASDRSPNISYPAGSASNRASET